MDFESQYKYFLLINCISIIVNHKQPAMLAYALWWRHTNVSVSNHWPLNCLLNSLHSITSWKHQSSALLRFVSGILWSLVDSPHKGSAIVIQKAFPHHGSVMPQYIRGEMIHFGHDTIRFMIHSSRYNTFHDTFVVLGWKAETYNPGLWSGAPHSTWKPVGGCDSTEMRRPAIRSTAHDPILSYPMLLLPAQ